MAASALPSGSLGIKKMVLVTANKGGVGKTTTCVNLSTAAAKDGARVLGIDLEPQHNFSKWSKRRPRDLSPVPVIEGDLDNYQTALLRAGGYDVVIIDTPPGIGPSMVAIQDLAKRADLVVVPTGLGIFDMETVIPYAQALHGVTGDRVSFVLNRIDSRIKNSDLVDAVSMLMGAGKVNNLPIPDLVDIERYMRGGISIVDAPVKSHTNTVQSLWQYVKGEVNLG